MATMLTLPGTNGFIFWGLVENKVYEKYPKAVYELKNYIFDTIREIDKN